MHQSKHINHYMSTNIHQLEYINHNTSIRIHNHNTSTKIHQAEDNDHNTSPRIYQPRCIHHTRNNHNNQGQPIIAIHTMLTMSYKYQPLINQFYSTIKAPITYHVVVHSTYQKRRFKSKTICQFHCNVPSFQLKFLNSK